MADYLALLVSSPVSGLPAEQAGIIPFSTAPASATFNVGDTFTISVRVGASASQPVDTATAHVNYNSNLLRVVDQAGNPASVINQGTILTSGTWKDLLDNQVTVSGSSGKIVFSAGKGLNGTNASSEFELASIRFKALAPTSGTNVTFNRVTVPITKALRGGVDLTGTTSGATITITQPSGTACSPPVLGDWIVTQSCTFSGSATAPANVIVQSGVTLTIAQNATLNIKFASNHLRIRDGARVVIKNGGKIN